MLKLLKLAKLQLNSKCEQKDRNQREINQQHLPLLLRHAPVDGDGWEILLHQQQGQSHTAMHRLNKDHHLTGTKRKGLNIFAALAKELMRYRQAVININISLLDDETKF